MIVDTLSMSDSQSAMSDSTQAMQSLLTAYADNEVDDDPAADEQHPGANFISDDEEEHRGSSEKSDKQPVNDEGVRSLSDRLISEEAQKEKDSPVISPNAKRPRLQHTDTGLLPCMSSMLH